MPFPFDATLKDFATEYPADCRDIFDRTKRPVRVLNVDLSTISAATDVALGLGQPLEEILDINFQSGPDPYLADRVEMYRAVLRHRYHVPVRSLIVLLRPQADQEHLTGKHSYGTANNGVPSAHEVMRLWNESPDLFLRSGVGLLPLAVLCRLPDDVPPADAIAKVVREIAHIAEERVSESEAVRILTSAYTLAGMRVRDEGELSRIFQEYGMVKHSSVWDQKLYEGELRGIRESILRQGKKKFGNLPDAIVVALNEIDDKDRLAAILDSVHEANNWDDLVSNQQSR